MMRIVCILCMLAFPSQAATIAVVESYHAEYPWVAGYRTGLETVLSPRHTLQYFEMDTKRLPSEQHAARARSIWRSIEDSGPELIIIADDNALKLLSPFLSSSERRFVYLGINANPREYGLGVSDRYTGVLERPNIKASIFGLKEALNLRKVLILSEQSTTSDAMFANMLGYREAFNVANVEVNFIRTRRFSDWKRIVLNAQQYGYDAIIVGLFYALVDEQGLSVPGDEVISWTSENTSIPPLALYDYAVGHDKALGGIVISGLEQGEYAGTLAARFLANTDVPSMPLVRNNSTVLFSAQQTEKWGITLSAQHISNVRYVR